MICTESLNINLNKIMLLAIGLWPYQQSKFVRVQLIIFLNILVSFIIFQFTTFLTSECTPELFINVLPSILFYSTFLLKYSSFNINIKIKKNNTSDNEIHEFVTIKRLLEQLQHIYNELIDENEIIIIRKYSRYAKYLTTSFILCGIFCTSLLILYSFWPRILDVLLPLNEPRSRSSLMPVTEYFVDQEKYFYLILLHANTAFLIGYIAMFATGATFVTCILYACGMFRIARFSDSSISRFKGMFLLLIAIGVICGSLNFYRGLLFGYDFDKFLLSVLFVIIHFMYLMIGTFVAQEIIDHNNDVFVNIYSMPWYLTPLHVQKMTLFLLQRNAKAFNLNLGGLFVGSLENATVILSTAVSYFTVLYSTQH